MAHDKSKGNIFYEILIVILTVVLVASIIYPKRIQESEENNQRLARYRMDEILKAQLQYQKYHNRYNDTLSTVLDFIKTSPQYAFWVDSVIYGRLDSIQSTLSRFRTTEAFILSKIDMATDSVMIDSLATMQFDMKFASRRLASNVQVLHDRMKVLPNMPLDNLVTVFKIVDSKQFTMDMDIVRNSIQAQDTYAAKTGANDMLATIDEVMMMFDSVKGQVPGYRSAGLDSLAFCPSTGKPFQLVHVDTSVIKYINIYSPIDNDDIAMVQKDFLKSKLGGLKMENHGKIESGEKSWEAR